MEMTPIGVIRTPYKTKQECPIQPAYAKETTGYVDIKPYVPQFDCFPEASGGWTVGKTWRGKPPGRE